MLSEQLKHQKWSQVSHFGSTTSMSFLDCHSTFLLDFFLAAGTVLCFEFTGNNIGNTLILELLPNSSSLLQRRQMLHQMVLPKGLGQDHRHPNHPWPFHLKGFHATAPHITPNSKGFVELDVKQKILFWQLWLEMILPLFCCLTQLEELPIFQFLGGSWLKCSLSRYCHL